MPTKPHAIRSMCREAHRATLKKSEACDDTALQRLDSAAWIEGPGYQDQALHWSPKVRRPADA
jgi:hypothetical protein